MKSHLIYCSVFVFRSPKLFCYSPNSLILEKTVEMQLSILLLILNIWVVSNSILLLNGGTLTVLIPVS